MLKGRKVKREALINKIQSNQEELKDIPAFNMKFKTLADFKRFVEAEFTDGVIFTDEMGRIHVIGYRR